MSRTGTMAPQRSSLAWWRNVLTRDLLVLFFHSVSHLALLHTTAASLISNLCAYGVCVCVIGCISADPHLIQGSVHPASQGWLDSEPSSPHGEILQVGCKQDYDYEMMMIMMMIIITSNNNACNDNNNNNKNNDCSEHQAELQRKAQ